jgi:hypothetical protein
MSERPFSDLDAGREGMFLQAPTDSVQGTARLDILECRGKDARKREIHSLYSIGEFQPVQ